MAGTWKSPDQWQPQRFPRNLPWYIWIALYLLYIAAGAGRLSLAALARRSRGGDADPVQRGAAPPPLVVVRPATAAAPGRPFGPRDFRQVNEDGFGDRWNSYPWSMRWWRGALYVGTNRAFPCLEYLTIRKLVGLLRYPPRYDPDVRCTDSPYDLPLRAELWRLRPETEQWERVYQSPQDVPVPGQPGRFLARDVGYRNLTVFVEPGGREALYVCGVSARSIDGRLPPPRLLRSLDGERFEPVPAEPGTVLGDLGADKIGFRAAAVYQGRLYVTAGSLQGAGALFESSEPWRGNNHFRQVSPAEMRVSEVAVFGGALYVGVQRPLSGFAVMKTDAVGPPPYRFVPVVEGGGHRWPLRSHTALSLYVFRGALYAGTDVPAELIRIYPDGQWDLLVGKARRPPQGAKRPLSGLGDGFGYPLNLGIARMQEHDGWLYIGTWSNEASKLREVPVIGRLLGADIGCDLYATQDGVRYVAVTRDGLGERANSSARTFASTPAGLFLGVVNEHRGARVYLARPQLGRCP